MMRLNENFVLREIYDVYLLIPIKKNSISNDVVSLNKTSALIFKECSKFEDVHELVENLIRIFNVENDSSIEKELTLYIQEMINQGLIVY